MIYRVGSSEPNLEISELSQLTQMLIESLSSRLPPERNIIVIDATDVKNRRPGQVFPILGEKYILLHYDTESFFFIDETGRYDGNGPYASVEEAKIGLDNYCKDHLK